MEIDILLTNPNETPSSLRLAASAGCSAAHRGQTVALRVPPDRSFDAVGSIAEAPGIGAANRCGRRFRSWGSHRDISWGCNGIILIVDD